MTSGSGSENQHFNQLVAAHGSTDTQVVIPGEFGVTRQGVVMKIFKSQTGVTLAELLITLSMSAILLSLGVPSFSQFIAKRTVAGAANLVAVFFENVKMESLKRSEFMTVNYKKSTSGTGWCIGAVTGKDVACDCMAATPQCLVDSVAMVLSNETYARFDDLTVSFTDGFVTFDPVRGILADPESSVAMQIQHTSEEFLVKVTVNSTGSVSKCSPPGEKQVGYPTCI